MIFLSIGTNLSSENGNKIYNLKEAINQLNINNIKVIKCSSVYETPSYPDKNNPKFLNIVTEVKFENTPYELLDKILLIEKKMGRIRINKNEPRICDIDVIDFKKQIIKVDKLEIPHPLAANRNFVLFPLKEICADWRHPISNENIDILIGNLTNTLRNEITRIDESAILL